VIAADSAGRDSTGPVELGVDGANLGSEAVEAPAGFGMALDPVLAVLALVPQL
jgi:hypothetical protein